MTVEDLDKLGWNEVHHSGGSTYFKMYFPNGYSLRVSYYGACDVIYSTYLDSPYLEEFRNISIDEAYNKCLAFINNNK